MNDKRNSQFAGAARNAKRVHTVSGIVLNYEGSSDLTFVRSPDVSTRGMFINTARNFPEGAILNVRFRLGLTGATVCARGEVRYSLPGVGIGLEFVGLEAATLKRLEREVECSARFKRRSKSLRLRTGKRKGSQRGAAEPKRNRRVRS